MSTTLTEERWECYYRNRFVGFVYNYNDYETLLDDYHAHPNDVDVVDCPYVGHWGLTYMEK